MRRFQSTHPARDATNREFSGTAGVWISIHASREGCDLPLLFHLLFPLPISIHASREGCDPHDSHNGHTDTPFQSTHPARDATQHVGKCNLCILISIHASREGCDHAYTIIGSRGISISIHASREGCDNVPRFTDNGLMIISIHASREGCDISNPLITAVVKDFNPRIPRGMRPSCCKAILASSGISIHASREGCDVPGSGCRQKKADFNPRIPRGMRLSKTVTPAPFFIFQSTHPARDATGIRFSTFLTMFDFNPRIPRGMRQEVQ